MQGYTKWVEVNAFISLWRSEITWFHFESCARRCYALLLSIPQKMLVACCMAVCFGHGLFCRFFDQKSISVFFLIFTTCFSYFHFLFCHILFSAIWAILAHCRVWKGKRKILKITLEDFPCMETLNRSQLLPGQSLQHCTNVLCSAAGDKPAFSCLKWGENCLLGGDRADTAEFCCVHVPKCSSLPRKASERAALSEGPLPACSEGMQLRVGPNVRSWCFAFHWR